MSTPQAAGHLQLLLATDLSAESLPHVSLGARLADQLGARTTLFHAVVPVPMGVPYSPAEVPYAPTIDVEAARQRLQEIAATLITNRPVHTDLEMAANARRAILAAADRVHADMLVLPTHGRSGLQRALLGSTAEDVVRHATRPVLLLTDRMLQRPPARDPGQPFVLVPTDLTADAAAALQPAADLARRLGLPLLLLSVLPTREGPPLGGGAPVAPKPSDPQVRVHDRLQELRRLATELGPDLHVEVFACIADDPAATIVAKAAELGTAFVVVATHGRTGLARLFRGSVAEAIVRHSTVPVVCVPMPHA